MDKYDVILMRWEQLVKLAIVTKSPLLSFYKKRLRDCLKQICDIKYPTQ